MMPAEVSSDTGWIAAALMAIPLIGGGIRWLFTRKDRREAKLEQREEAYVKKIEERLAQMEGRVTDLQVGFQLLWAALLEKDPHNPALASAASLMRKSFPLNVFTPPEMADRIADLDRAANGMAPNHLWRERP